MEISVRKGSMTVEASIVLPIFISVIITIAFFVKIVYVHELIQHSITETADQMASYAYIYHISGLQGAHDSVRDGLKSRAELFKDHLSTVMDSFKSLKSIPGEAEGSIKDGNLQDTEDLIKNAGQNFKNITGAAGQAAQNPLGELESAAAMIMGGAFDNITTELCIPLVDFYMKKYLVTDEIKDADTRLKGLNVIGGFSGLDFSESSFFEDDSNDIDIVVKYKLSIPVPFKALPTLLMIQRGDSKAWLGGDEVPTEAGENGDDVWTLGNFQRGDALRKQFGANLPGTFPVISSFDPKTGVAVMIKSMDLTASSYRSKDGVEKQLQQYIATLAAYKGQEEPWGQKGIVIPGSGIKEKQLLLVIPENPVGQGVEDALNECISSAAKRGVTLKIQRYGTKKIDGADEASNGQKTDSK